MQSYKRGLWLLILLSTLVACGPAGGPVDIAVESPPQAEPVVEVEPAVEAEPMEAVAPAIEAVSPCEVTDEQLGQEIAVAGQIALVDDADPNGTYAELEASGCRVGVFVPSERWARWSAEQQNVFQAGQQIAIGGTLVSFEGHLIVDASGPPQAIEGEAAPSPEVAAPPMLDLPPAPDSAHLDVPVVYSGLDGTPGMCYLGAFAMLVKYEHPELDFADVVAFSGVGSNALYLDFPDMPSTLTNRYTDVSMINTARNMEAPYVLGFGRGGNGSDPFQPAGIDFEDNAAGLISFAGGDEALDTLKRAVASEGPVVVFLDLYTVHDDFAAASSFWRDVLGKDHASHYMVVTGYDAETVYLNDPTDPTSAAANLPADVENFMQAWGNTLDMPDAPPIGPYWMIFLAEPGSVPATEEVIAWNVETARDAPSEIRQFAQNPGNSDSACFMMGEMARGRMEFANYLERNGWAEAAAGYRQSGTLLAEAAAQRQTDPAILEEIAALEEAALASLGGPG